MGGKVFKAVAGAFGAVQRAFCGVGAKTADVFFRLRLRVCLTMLFVVFVICVVSIGAVNLYIASSNQQNASCFLSAVAQNGGYGLSASSGQQGRDFWVWHFAEPDADKASGHQSHLNRFLERIFVFRPNLLLIRDFYSARLDSSGRIASTISPFVSPDLNARAQELAKAAFDSGKREGRYRDFLFRIDAYDGDGGFVGGSVGGFAGGGVGGSGSGGEGGSGGGFDGGSGSGGDGGYVDGGYLFVVADRTMEYAQEKRLFAGCATGLFFMLLLAFVIVWNFSRIAVDPVKDAFERQRNFIADASHELKTPIAVIGANIDVLEQELLGNKWLGYIKTENSRMAELVKDLLFLAKNDADRSSLCMMRFDFANAVEGAALPFESVAMEQGKTMHISVPDEELWVVGDEARIKQVAVILIDNAIKNSDAGAVIRVSARAEGKKCFLSVYNTGHGIAQKDIPLIFNRFYRSDSSRARSTGGYGLGLTIAKSIADCHRAKILVQSEEGSYAQFTFVMPSCIVAAP